VKAKECWERTLQLNPNDDNAKRGLPAAIQNLAPR
jgi:hypothetical protein